MRIELDYSIISSGSDGNCVRIGQTMIDIGVPYKHIKDELYLVKTLLITHKHTDHVRKATYERMRREFPDIEVVANWEVASLYDVDIICNEGFPIEVNGITYTPFRGNHNALCYGYTWNEEGYDIIYATDMRDFSGAPQDKKYDYMFLESNHDKHKLNAVLTSNKKYGYDVYGAGIMHCSTQDCLAFYYMNRRSKDSELIELHKSSRFY